MAWYYGTYRCGHEGRVNVIGPGKNRQWKIDRHFENLCPECWETRQAEKRAKASAEAAEKAKEMELPELSGTEKQVVWATTLRQSLIDRVEKNIENVQNKFADDPRLDEVVGKANNLLQYIITNKTAARWYIDGRDDNLERIFRETEEEMKKEQKEESPEMADIKSEATIYPEKPVTNAAVNISVLDNKVTAEFERNEDFRLIVKELGYEWQRPVWAREITKTTGAAVDRAAELGNKLLNAGFPICIIDNEARQKAIDGTYEPECKRWVYLRAKGDYEGWFALKWTDNSDLYDKARKLPGSKWSRPCVVVKTEHFAEVQDFAELYCFRFTEAATGALEKAKDIREAAKMVKPAQPQEPEQKDGLKEILNSGSDIIDDLKD